ncbi:MULTISPECIES: hypothetical protein [unclassified Parabacteroides]|uniref:hypothetical protein n=1 Tax=unclassified Parabacteroides TaxID=2649774 RepID=UPI0024750E80|nr:MULTISPECIES: hypothetical protein [unclassified Parabacteroides]
MTKAANKYCLYAGLSLLAAAILLRWLVAGFPLFAFWTLMGVAILLKSIFLVNVFREKGFRPALWLYLILAGVCLILLSMLFKYVFVLPLLRNILFFGAILLKISGLALLLIQRKI